MCMLLMLLHSAMQSVKEWPKKPCYKPHSETFGVISGWLESNPQYIIIIMSPSIKYRYQRYSTNTAAKPELRPERRKCDLQMTSG